MSINMEVVDFIAGLLVWGQALMFIPSIAQLIKDRQVIGMSVMTIAFYALVSWFWVWVLYLNELYWSMLGLFVLAIVETIWVAYAALLKGENYG